MKIYLVGGAVRDALLGLPIKERDYVVVGAKPEDLLRQGYKQVGKEFPVFLHPKTNEEYALARLERKVAPGYTGFVFDSSPDVKLEEDLLRRDLTINAMAESLDGELIDPYQGRHDLEQRILRHVSPAFSEDPVRILRLARFAARYAHLGFQVAPETNQLMKDMVASGEIDALVPERVWKELERALGEPSPEVFFEALAACNALDVLFPEFKLKSPGMEALKRAVNLSNDTAIRFAALMQDTSPELIDAFCKRYRLPEDYRELAKLASRFSAAAWNFSHLSAEEMLKLFSSTDAFRREERFLKFLCTCEAKQDSLSFPRSQINEAYLVAKKVDVKDFITKDLTGPQIADKLKQFRIEAIKALLRK